MPHATTEEEFKRIAEVQANILRIAKAYGVRNKANPYTTQACVKLVLNNFSHLSLKDIEEAFRLKSIGKIQVYGAEAYGGELNVDMFGKTLAAYDEARKGILARYINTKAQYEAEESGKASVFLKRLFFEICFPYKLHLAKEKIERWQDVPEFWYKAAKERNMIHFEPGEARTIFDECKAFAETEIKLARQQEVNNKNAKNERVQDKSRRLAVIVKDRDPVVVQKVISRQVSVWRKIINNPDWNYLDYYNNG